MAHKFQGFFSLMIILAVWQWFIIKGSGWKWYR